MPAKLSPREAYRLWAPDWDAEPSAIVALESRTLAPWLAGVTGRIVVDVSCGTGRWLSFAQSRGAIVFGVDLCLEMLAEARKKSGLSGKLALSDAARLPLADDCADIALCALSFGHMTSLEAAIAEMARIVRPGGSVVISDFHPAATERGWKRTFPSGGIVYEIETRAYTIEQMNVCAERSGLRLQDLSEPGFGEPERPIFERAGKQELFEQIRSLPAVVVARWMRP